MPPSDPNLPQLLAIAETLGDLRDEVVFVGGATAGLLLTDPLAAGVRPTVDVDAIVKADDLVHFHRFEAGLEQRGFIRDAGSGVICRWKHRATGTVFDLIPTDAAVLGFSNRWYDDAIATAQTLRLSNGLDIRVVAAPAFVATKLEAFASRGGGDFLSSHDLEDVLNIVDGRPELPAELEGAADLLRRFVGQVFAGLLADSDFINCLPGLIADADRAGVVTERLRHIAAQS